MLDWDILNSTLLLIGKYRGDAELASHLSGRRIDNSFVQEVTPCYYARVDDEAIAFTNGTKQPGYTFRLPCAMRANEAGWNQITIDSASPLLTLACQKEPKAQTHTDVDKLVLAWAKREGRKAYEQVVSCLLHLKHIHEEPRFFDALLRFARDRMVGELSQYLSGTAGNVNAVDIQTVDDLLKCHSRDVIRFLLNPVTNDIGLSGTDDVHIAMKDFFTQLRQEMEQGSRPNAPERVKDYYTYYRLLTELLLDKVRMPCMVLWHQMDSVDKTAATLAELLGRVASGLSNRCRHAVDYKNMLGDDAYEKAITPTTALTGRGAAIASSIMERGKKCLDRRYTPSVRLSRDEFQRSFMVTPLSGMIAKMSPAGEATLNQMEQFIKKLEDTQFREAETTWADGKALTDEEWTSLLQYLSLAPETLQPAKVVDQVKEILDAIRLKLGEAIDQKVKENLREFQIIADLVEVVYSGTVLHNAGGAEWGVTTASLLDESENATLAAAYRNQLVEFTEHEVIKNLTKEWNALCQEANNAARKLDKQQSLSLRIGDAEFPVDQNAAPDTVPAIAYPRTSDATADPQSDEPRGESGQSETHGRNGGSLELQIGLFSGDEDLVPLLDEKEVQTIQQHVTKLCVCSALRDREARGSVVQQLLELHGEAIRGKHATENNREDGENESLALLLAECINALPDEQVGFGHDLLAHEYAILTKMVEVTGRQASDPKQINLSDCFPTHGRQDVVKILEYYYQRCEQARELVQYASRIVELDTLTLSTRSRASGLHLRILDCTLDEYSQHLARGPELAFFGVNSDSKALSIFVTRDAATGIKSLDDCALNNADSVGLRSLLFLDNGEDGSNTAFFQVLTTTDIPDVKAPDLGDPKVDATASPLLMLAVTSLVPDSLDGGGCGPPLSLKYTEWTAGPVFSLFQDESFMLSDRGNSAQVRGCRTWNEVFRKLWCYDSRLANAFIGSRLWTIARAGRTRPLNSWLRAFDAGTMLWKVEAFKPLTELYSLLIAQHGQSAEAQFHCQLEGGDPLKLPLNNPPVATEFKDIRWSIRRNNEEHAIS